MLRHFTLRWSNSLVVRALDSQSEVPGSKLLSVSKVGAAFYSSEVDQMSTSYSWELMAKIKLSPCSDSVALRQLNPIYDKSP